MRFHLKSCVLCTLLLFIAASYLHLIANGRTEPVTYVHHDHDPHPESYRRNITRNLSPWSLRIVVLTFNRSSSLSSCLASLQDLHLDGTPAVLEIRIDRFRDGKVNPDVLKEAHHFKWTLGEKSVFIQENHVGIKEQWINSWRPASDDSREIVLILEDDIDVSPFAVRWLKAAHDFYDSQSDVAGYGLVDIEIPLACHGDILKPSEDVVAFKFARFCTFGFSPKADIWRRFQSWYKEKSQLPSFKPYTPSDPLFTKWFQIFEKSNTSEAMWSIWFIKFCDEQGLYTVYPNTNAFLHAHHSEKWLTDKEDTGLAHHRREGGLHFQTDEARSSEPFLLKEWCPDLVNFSPNIPSYDISRRAVCVFLSIRDKISQFLSVFDFR